MKGIQQAPLTLRLYALLALSACVLAALPSPVHSTFTWLVIGVQILLLFALARRIAVARIALVFLAVLWLLPVIAFVGESAPLAALACLQIVMAGLLLTSPMRRWANAGTPWGLSPSEKDQ